MVKCQVWVNSRRLAKSYIRISCNSAFGRILAVPDHLNLGCWRKRKCAHPATTCPSRAICKPWKWSLPLL